MAVPIVCQSMSWDSRFFGMDVGKVEYDDAGAEDELSAAVEEGGSYDLLYLVGKTPIADGLRGRADLVEVNIHYTGRLREMRADISTSTSSPLSRIRSGLISDVSELASLAAQLSAWSRFAQDPRLGPAVAARLYRRWFHNAATGAFGRLFVADDRHGICGAVTVSGSQPLRVGLLGATKPGCGIGEALLRGACASLGAAEIDVSTQLRNESAQSFYEHIGLVESSRTWVYHHWAK